MANISTISHTFDTTPGLPDWQLWGGALYTYVNAGDLVLKNDPGTNNYHGLSTEESHDWTGQSGSVGLGSLATLVGGAEAPYSVTVLNAEINTANRYYWSWEGLNQLVCMKVVADDYQYVGAVGLGTIKRVRIRFNVAGTTAYYEYTSDQYGLTGWTEVGNIATTGVPCNDLFANMASGNWGPITGNYESRLTDFNAPPTPPVVTPTNRMLLMF